MLHTRVARMRGINLMQAATAGELLQSRMQHAGNQPVLKALMEVTHFPELVFDPTGVYPLFVVPELGRAEIILEQCGEGRLGGKHAALDGQMNALKTLRVQEAG